MTLSHIREATKAIVDSRRQAALSDPPDLDVFMLTSYELASTHSMGGTDVHPFDADPIFKFDILEWECGDPRVHVSRHHFWLGVSYPGGRRGLAQDVLEGSMERESTFLTAGYGVTFDP